MITKTQETTKKGEVIYQHALTGHKGTLSEMNFLASTRREDRRGTVQSKVRTNRKRTLGRNTHLQQVNEVVGKKKVLKIVHDVDGKMKTTKKGVKIRIPKDVDIVNPTGKVIKHVQETPNALRRKIALFNFIERVELLKAKWHKDNPQYQKKQ